MNKLTIAEYRSIWKSQGLCQDCGNKPTTSFRCTVCAIKHKEANTQYIKANKAQLKLKYAAGRERVIRHYGNVCVCCGEAEMRFLTLDHINSDGYTHRKSGRKNMWQWAIQNEFPPIFQTLCFNCNCGRAHNGGICPHQVSKAIEASV